MSSIQYYFTINLLYFALPFLHFFRIYSETLITTFYLSLFNFICYYCFVSGPGCTYTYYFINFYIVPEMLFDIYILILQDSWCVSFTYFEALVFYFCVYFRFISKEVPFRNISSSSFFIKTCSSSVHNHVLSSVVIFQSPTISSSFCLCFFSVSYL